MSHKEKHDYPPFQKRRQRTAEQSLKYGRSYLTGGPETLDVNDGNVDRAPLWEDDHGMNKPEENQ